MPFGPKPVVPVGRTVRPPLVHLSCFRRGADLEERPQDPVLHRVHPPASLDHRSGDEQEARSVPAGHRTLSGPPPTPRSSIRR